ncbi:hypothetical protein NBRC110019_21040 [Neptunitalea chrysea]|uniref:TonB-dependent receptor n=1 Tax=Neptunitalea chrysea TaxID=1647581 RepID=A0A9W6B5N1_9FLAO|nr:carboxypeptidase-like regulatory domain-containing protein [Neptunitalea chrysea]GLB53064.1 hypothetical protein NBRC110019_21040 [Neptunitalea chrysea]
MYDNKINTLVLLLLLFTGFLSFGQEGIVSGTVNDSDGLPLPGCVIQVKGTDIGASTDFDGNYTIKCAVGDVLVFSYVGFNDWEATVTAEMLEGDSQTVAGVRVKPILSDAYSQMLQETTDSTKVGFVKKNISLMYTNSGGNNYPKLENIKDIKIDDKKVKVINFRENVGYEITYNGTVSWLSITKHTLPQLQTTYAQGRLSNGSNQYFGPEDNEVFSYGPSVTSLTFDNTINLYDSNGNIVGGTGSNLLPYQNTLFTTGKRLSNNLKFRVANDVHDASVSIRRKSQEDLFGVETSRELQGTVQYEYKWLQSYLRVSDEKLNQPDVNGFYSNLIMANAVTPVSFQNSQGYIFSDETQRSFSPANYNNPLWLLHTNANGVFHKSVVAHVDGIYKKIENIELYGQLSYQQNHRENRFGLPLGTVGFEDGYRYSKDFKEKNFDTEAGITYKTKMGKSLQEYRKHWVEMESRLSLSHNKLAYALQENSQFADVQFHTPLVSILNKQDLNNTVFRLKNKVKFETYNEDISIELGNHSVFSKVQGNKAFLPYLDATVDLHNLIDELYFLRQLKVSLGVSHNAIEMPLYYANQAHNSLLYSASGFQGYRATNDLFLTNNLSLETIDKLDIGTAINIHSINLWLFANYYIEKHRDVIFPVQNGTGFLLKNVANSTNNGITLSIDSNVRIGSGVNNDARLTFSKSSATIDKLSGGMESLPVAGFTEVSKNLIEGTQVGSIVGSAYMRDVQGNKVIGTDGFPLVAVEKKVIGNTTPDFTMSLDNTFEVGDFNLNFVLDWQQGGDVWNGTNNVLNYLGRSKESRDLRGITNYIFDGVTTTGAPNTVPVAFANAEQDVAQNRWVRYGYTGVGEDAIADASYITLKTVSISYDFGENYDDHFFRKLEVSLYANNLWCATKTKGIAPYTSLFNSTSGSGLHYFNMPLVKEIGIKLNLQI